jgi:hypothetical protein
MRAILTSGSTRGEEVGPLPRFPSYSTAFCVPLRLLVGEREFWTLRLLPRVIVTRMSRLRRALSDRWFFITCRVLPRRRRLSDCRIRHLGAGDRRTAGRTQVSSHRLGVPPGPLTCHFLSAPSAGDIACDGSHQRGAAKGINRSRRETERSRRGTQKARTSALPAHSDEPSQRPVDSG